MHNVSTRRTGRGSTPVNLHRKKEKPNANVIRRSILKNIKRRELCIRESIVRNGLQHLSSNALIVMTRQSIITTKTTAKN